MAMVVIGEAVVDFLPDPERPGSFRPLPGGSPLNVATGLARLGAPAAYLWALSSDLFGDLFRRHLGEAGVDLSLTATADRPSTLAFVAMREGQPAYAFFDEGSAGRMFDPAAVSLPEETALVHAGSYVLACEPVGASIERCLRAARGRGISVSLDVNVRKSLVADPEAYRARLKRLFRLANIVKASEEDIFWLAPGTAPEEFAAQRLADGAELAVVTLGGEGALLAAGHHRLRVAAPAIAFVDAVGAGDAFMAALLGGLFRRGLLGLTEVAAETDLLAVLDEAVAAGGIACSRAGADPPTRAELDAFVESWRAGGPGDSLGP
jgi:fructokinase